MRTVEEIERAIAELSREDLSTFRRWFEEIDASAWDRQVEEDVAAGRLQALADEALADLCEGRTHPLRSRPRVP